MKRFIAAIGAIFYVSILGLAAAQEPPPPPAASTPASVAAARDMLSAMLVESGLLEHTITLAFQSLRPQMRSDIEGAPFYRSLRQAHKDALNTYLETLPDLIQTELQRVAPVTLDTAAPPIAALLTEQEMHDIAAFARDPEGKDILLAVITMIAQNRAADDAPLTAAQTQLLARFKDTAGGRAMAAHGDAIGAVLERSLLDSFRPLEPQLRARVSQDLCRLLEDECPAEMRTTTPT
jgi:hypothetical protein